jgi:hypothetical protein
MNNALSFARVPIRPSPIASHLFVSTDEGGEGCVHGIYRLLADEEHIYGAEIKVIIKWECGEAIVCRMLAGIKLEGADIY